MSSDFKDCSEIREQRSHDSFLNQDVSSCQPFDVMDNLKRDRFELLSAYLDGEVTAAERRQVEEWLANDPTIQCLYSRLVKLRQGMRNLPAPPASLPTEQTVQQVMRRVGRPQPMAVLAWGGAAIAAVFVGLVSNLAPTASVSNFVATPSPATTSTAIESEALILAIDQPIIEIPRAIATEAESVNTIPLAP